MISSPMILDSGLEVHYIQQQEGNDDQILDIYELRKNFGKRLKSIWRFEVPEGSDEGYIKARLKESRAELSKGAQHETA